jgi:hypothetical protein
MKNAWRAQTVAAIVSVLAVTGCSTTQPDSVGTRDASVSFAANALVEIWDCYEEWQDTTGPNGVPDGTPDIKINDSLVCFPALDDLGQQIRTQRAVPWNYSVKITVIHPGSVNEEVVVSSDGATVGSSVEFNDTVPDFVSLTNYDPDMPPAPLHANVGDIYYINGVRLSTGSPIYLANIGVDPGVPNLLQLDPPTFDFNLNTGDTVIVRVRKQDTSQAPPGIPPYPDLKLTASLNVSGVATSPVSTPPGNPPTTSADNKAGMTFSFTVR